MEDIYTEFLGVSIASIWECLLNMPQFSIGDIPEKNSNSKIHQVATRKDANNNTDQSRAFGFLASISNTEIADKIQRKTPFPAS